MKPSTTSWKGSLLKIFDCDVAYGRGTMPLPRELETLAALIAELDHNGIDEALVWHVDARERGFEGGNRRLLEIQAEPRLHESLTFAPTCCREMAPTVEFLQNLQTEKVRAVRAFPATHKFLFDPICCGDLLELLSANFVPLIVPLGEFQEGWQGVYTLMRDFPRLTLILTQSGCWGEDRLFRPLMKNFPNFYLSTSRLETAGQLKGIVDSVGPDHLVFGSGLPYNYPGAYIMSITRAEISDEARAAIFAGNLERILEEVAW
jgi:uncharacterized protein